MYGCESWIIKKAERRRIDAFELWYERRLLRVPWTARIPNQSILKDISPGCSLEGLMLKLKLQYFGHLMQRADSLEKTLRLGKIEGCRRGQQKMWWLDGIPNQWTWVCVNLGVGERQGGLVCCDSWGHKESDTTERLYWTELICGRRSNQVNPNGKQPWILIGKNGPEAKASVLWPPDEKSRLTGKDPGED